MRVRINKELVTTVLKNGGKELQEFEALSPFLRLDILTEVFQRIFLTFWMYSGSKKSDWNRKRVVEKKKKKSEDGSTNFDNEMLTKVILLSSKVTESGEEIEDDVPNAKDDDQKKKPLVTAKAKFLYDEKKGILEIEVEDVKGPDMVTEILYQNELENELEAAKVAMENDLDMEDFLKGFFNTLHVHDLTTVMGGEAISMYRIYKNARVAYPVFRSLNYGEQINLLRKGYRSARTISSHARDIYSFAKATFDAFDEHGAILEKVFAREPISNKFKTYTRVGENRLDRRNPEKPSQIWESDCLIYVQYEYEIAGGATLRSAMLAFDLWEKLAKNVYTEAGLGVA